MEEALGRPRREPVAGEHHAPASFVPKQAVPIAISVASQGKPAKATLYYRHVNQAERYQSLEMEHRGSGFHADIPSAYTDSPYPLQYYFEFRKDNGTACLYPGFAEDRLNQPYFVVRRA
jgi:hypothetical protein